MRQYSWTLMRPGAVPNVGLGNLDEVEGRSIVVICREYQLHPGWLTRWKPSRIRPVPPDIITR